MIRRSHPSRTGAALPPLAPPRGWAVGAVGAWFEDELVATRARVEEALRRAPDPDRARDDLRRILTRPAGPSAPAGADVALSRVARGELVVEGEGRPERLDPRSGERLEAAAVRATADALRERALDGAADPGREVAQQRAVLEAARAVAAARGAFERARAALFTRPPLVLASSWCVALSRLPEGLAREVIAAGGCADLEGDGASLPGQAVDTRRLPPDLAARVVAALGPRDRARQGVLVEGDNARALRLLGRRLHGRVQCAYLDPPFNTASRSFAYHDDLPSALWLASLDERLSLIAPLLRDDGALFAHIDGHEKERLRLLLDEHLHHVTEVIWRIGWVSGFKTKANKFIRNHDTIYHYGRSPRPLFVKQYLPYPEGYVRRDGKPPRGAGYPLEDTWNCSAVDRLDSIQIKSFSREKVGDAGLTQKNEDLLERILLSSTREADLVLDPYLGSGTTAAVAHKLGRRWVGIERGAALEAYARPRLLRVLAGCPRGISARHGWRGGGAFQTLRLEPADLTAHNVLAPGERAAPGRVGYRLEGGRWRLDPAVWDDPLGARLAGPAGPVAVDLPETFVWLAALEVERAIDAPDGRLTVGRGAAGAPVVVAWRRPGASLARLLRSAADLADPPGVLFVHGEEAPRARPWGRWEVRRLEAAFDDVSGPSAGRAR